MRARREGAEAVAAGARGAADALHGAGRGQHIRDQDPVGAELVHDRGQQPVLRLAPGGDVLPAPGRAAHALLHLRIGTPHSGPSMAVLLMSTLCTC